MPRQVSKNVQSLVTLSTRSSSNQSTPTKKRSQLESGQSQNNKIGSNAFPLKKQFPQPQANGELKTSEFIGAAIRILTVYGKIYLKTI